MSEIYDLRWKYLEGDCIELPKANTGGRVVLSAIFREEDNLWVIAGRMPGTHLTDLQHPWRRSRARAELPDV